MKKILIALGFTLATMSSQAALVVNPIGFTAPTDQFNNVLNREVGALFEYGTLSSDEGNKGL